MLYPRCLSSGRADMHCYCVFLDGGLAISTLGLQWRSHLLSHLLYVVLVRRLLHLLLCCEKMTIPTPAALLLAGQFILHFEVPCVPLPLLTWF